MPDAAIAVDLDQPLDVHVNVAAEIALDLKVAVNKLAQPRDLVLGQILRPRVRVHPRRGQNLFAGHLTDAEDIRQRNLDALVAGDIYPGDSGHAPDPPRCLPTSRWPPPAVPRTPAKSRQDT